MEKAAVKKLKGRYAIRSSDVFCATFACLIGSSEMVITPLLIFLFVAFSYLRKSREAYISIFFILLFALEKDVLSAYFYALGFSLFFVLLHMVKVLNVNLYQWIPYLLAMVLIPYAIRQFGVSSKALLEPLLGGLLISSMLSESGWQQKQFYLARSLYGALLLGAGLLAAQALPFYYSQILLLAYLLISLICDETSTLALLAIILLLPMQSQQLIWVCILCMVYRRQRLLLCGLLCVSAAFLRLDFFTVAYLLLAIISAMLLKTEYLPLLAQPSLTENRESQAFLSGDNLLRRQMQNYAGIFQSLADYYAGIQETGAEVLMNMATALQYNAEEIQKVNTEGKQYDRLRKALEGYQFDVEMMQIEESRDGCLQLSIKIGNLRRGEIRMTLQPLLEGLLHRRLTILEIKKRRFVRGFYILFADALPYDIEAGGGSVKNAVTSSGDSYSIFRFRQSIICIISDGMGNGEQAAASSRLITSIFQKMIISGMPQDSAIRCINKLIQSDTYATMDVICINRSKGSAYISKSAACPTFLLRAGELHEINGTALPVGIIAAIEPDCFEIELQEGDEFLMISDGISRNEIDEWRSYRHMKTVKEDVEDFMAQLDRTYRKDDSTAILLRIKKS